MSHPHHRWPAVCRALRSSHVHASLRRRDRQRVRRQCSPLERLEERAVPAVITLVVESLADSGGENFDRRSRRSMPSPPTTATRPPGGDP
jgi:hypothetical protein